MPARRSQSTWLVAIVVLTTSTAARAATIDATSCLASDVQAALAKASAGDTIVVPAGTCHWSTSVAWNAPAGVTVMGAGTSSTGGDDKTVIVDDVSTNVPLLSIGVASAGTFRMTGMTIQGGTGALKDAGLVSLDGPGDVPSAVPRRGVKENTQMTRSRPTTPSTRPCSVPGRWTVSLPRAMRAWRDAQSVSHDQGKPSSPPGSDLSESEPFLRGDEGERVRKQPERASLFGLRSQRNRHLARVPNDSHAEVRDSSRAEGFQTANNASRSTPKRSVANHSGSGTSSPGK